MLSLEQTKNGCESAHVLEVENWLSLFVEFPRVDWRGNHVIDRQQELNVARGGFGHGCLREVDAIRFDGMQFRRDIGHRALKRG
jgi:hypothetical protein